MAYFYRIVISPLSDEDGGGFIGRVPDLPGCMSDGETQEEALKNTQEAVDEWLKENARLGRAVPKPGASAKRGQDMIESLFQRVNELQQILVSYENLDDRIESISGQLTELREMIEHHQASSRFAEITGFGNNGDDSDDEIKAC